MTPARRSRNPRLQASLLLLLAFLLACSGQPAVPHSTVASLTASPTPVATAHSAIKQTAPTSAPRNPQQEPILAGMAAGERACLHADITTDAELRQPDYAEIEHCLTLPSARALFLGLRHDAMSQRFPQDSPGRRVSDALAHVNRMESAAPPEPSQLADVIAKTLRASISAENVFIHCATVTEHRELTDRPPDASARQRSSCIIERSGGLNSYLTAVVANDGNLMATEDHR